MPQLPAYGGDGAYQQIAFIISADFFFMVDSEILVKFGGGLFNLLATVASLSINLTFFFNFACNGEIVTDVDTDICGEPLINISIKHNLLPLHDQVMIW